MAIPPAEHPFMPKDVATLLLNQLDPHLQAWTTTNSLTNYNSKQKKQKNIKLLTLFKT
ncbi:hypothetical protein Hanom_Chr09g00864541 [Helianthus anomalus]